MLTIHKVDLTVALVSPCMFLFFSRNGKMMLAVTTLYGSNVCQGSLSTIVEVSRVVSLLLTT